MKQEEIDYRTLEFTSRAKSASVHYEFKGAAAVWDPNIESFRCPVGTRNGGKITNRAGTTCGGPVARRAIRALVRGRRDRAAGRGNIIGRLAQRGANAAGRAADRLERPGDPEYKPRKPRARRAAAAASRTASRSQALRDDARSVRLAREESGAPAPVRRVRARVNARRVDADARQRLDRAQVREMGRLNDEWEKRLGEAPTRAKVRAFVDAEKAKPLPDNERARRARERELARLEADAVDFETLVKENGKSKPDPIKAVNELASGERANRILNDAGLGRRRAEVAPDAPPAPEAEAPKKPKVPEAPEAPEPEQVVPDRVEPQTPDPSPEKYREGTRTRDERRAFERRLDWARAKRELEDEYGDRIIQARDEARARQSRMTDDELREHVAQQEMLQQRHEDEVAAYQRDARENFRPMVDRERALDRRDQAFFRARAHKQAVMMGRLELARRERLAREGRLRDLEGRRHLSGEARQVIEQRGFERGKAAGNNAHRLLDVEGLEAAIRGYGEQEQRYQRMLAQRQFAVDQAFDNGASITDRELALDERDLVLDAMHGWRGLQAHAQEKLNGMGAVQQPKAPVSDKWQKRLQERAAIIDRHARIQQQFPGPPAGGPKLTDLKKWAREGNEAKVREWAEAIFNHQGLGKNKDYQSRVLRVSLDPDGSFSISGEVLDANGARAGHFNRNFFTGEKPPHVYNALFEIYGDHKKNQIGTGIVLNAERWYKAAGFKEVRVSAGLENGGYRWARSNFDAKNEAEMRRFTSYFKEALNRYDRGDRSKIKNDADASYVQRLLRDVMALPFNSPDRPRPIDFTLFDGAEEILRNAGWGGKKKL